MHIPLYLTLYTPERNFRCSDQLLIAQKQYEQGVTASVELLRILATPRKSKDILDLLHFAKEIAFGFIRQATAQCEISKSY
jgi:hypothetical protein